TAVTAQGYRIAAKKAGANLTVSFFPLDAGPVMARMIATLQPKAIVIAETEIWPNLIRQAAARDIPIILVNGRMSPKAHSRYRKIGGTLTRLLTHYDRFFFKSAEDQERYGSFGVSGRQSVVAGDMKFDAPLLARSAARIDAIRRSLSVGEDQFLFVAGSTRAGEEQLLLDLYRTVKSQHPSFRMVLVPRHIERAQEVRTLVDVHGFGVRLYGDAAQAPPEAITVVDRMGILNDLYLAADLAFVGGTLVEIGGHNLLEPVWARTPVVFGPSLGNVEEPAAYILEHNYGCRVENGDELARVVAEVISGTRTFSEKTDTEMTHSATAQVGGYILQRIQHA
ncbi:MAG: hypothetical protein KKA42_16095, partial [candidate division Zixibacteria bacterium]|nr:hypothetical protein [candidate division Zixibacteria bacterium]